MSKTKTIGARRAIAGDLAATLAAALTALLLTLAFAGAPLQLAIPPAVVGLAAAMWRLHQIVED